MAVMCDNEILAQYGSNLILGMNFFDSNTPTEDISDSQNTVSVIGNPGIIEDTDSKDTRSFHFSGPGDLSNYLQGQTDIGINISTWNTTQLTIVYRFKITDTYTGNGLFLIQNTQDTGQYIGVRANANQNILEIGRKYKYGTTYTLETTTLTYIPNKWHILVITQSNPNNNGQNYFKIYLDGVLVKQTVLWDIECAVRLSGLKMGLAYGLTSVNNDHYADCFYFLNTGLPDEHCLLFSDITGFYNKQITMNAPVVSNIITATSPDETNVGFVCYFDLPPDAYGLQVEGNLNGTGWLPFSQRAKFETDNDYMVFVGDVDRIEREGQRNESHISVSKGLAIGDIIRIRVRAIDFAGNYSNWIESESLELQSGLVTYVPAHLITEIKASNIVEAYMPR